MTDPNLAELRQLLEKATRDGIIYPIRLSVLEQRDVLRAVPALLDAAEREQRLREAVTEYLEWGAMTGSDRDLFETKFRKALELP